MKIFLPDCARSDAATNSAAVRRASVRCIARIYHR
jgi:hypothetical protein